MHGPTVPPGSTVRYRYRASGATRAGHVDYEPGPEGLFVYTGDRPEDVEILTVLPPGNLGNKVGDLDLDSDTARSGRCPPVQLEYRRGRAIQQPEFMDET